MIAFMLCPLEWNMIRLKSLWFSALIAWNVMCRIRVLHCRKLFCSCSVWRTNEKLRLGNINWTQVFFHAMVLSRKWEFLLFFVLLLMNTNFNSRLGICFLCSHHKLMHGCMTFRSHSPSVASITNSQECANEKFNKSLRRSGKTFSRCSHIRTSKLRNYYCLSNWLQDEAI